ncbi:DUF1887 family CARF protein [Empedobacter falsenii]
MNHQITFIGGQVLPVFIGINEFNPDKIYCIASEESKDKISLLKPIFGDKVFIEKECNPFDFLAIKDMLSKLVDQIQPTDEIQFNLTGGTKVMVLAAQAIMQEKNIKGFYINLDNTYLKLPSYEISKIYSEISTNHFLQITGHKLGNHNTLTDFSKEDFFTTSAIEKFSKKYNWMYLKINEELRRKFKDKYNRLNIPETGIMKIENQIILEWSGNKIFVISNGHNLLKIESPNARSLFFNAGWWELNVAKVISEWPKVKELLIQCELPFKSDETTTKNEIDILVNIGGKLIFVECKSGFVKQEDINKMSIIKDTYGGVISKSLLVCRFKPSRTIEEKCKELNIEIFYSFIHDDFINPISRVLDTLNQLEKKFLV